MSFNTCFAGNDRIKSAAKLNREYEQFEVTYRLIVHAMSEGE